MKKSTTLTTVINRKGLVFIGVILGLTMFGVIAWQVNAQDLSRSDARRSVGKRTERQVPSLAQLTFTIPDDNQWPWPADQGEANSPLAGPAIFNTGSPTPSTPAADHISSLIAACTGSNLTDFNLGDTVCGEIEDSTAAAGRRFDWQHGGTIWQTSASFTATTPQHDFYTIPSTTTSALPGFPGTNYDVRGTWRLAKIRATNHNLLGVTEFRVHDPAHIASDLSVSGNVTSANPVAAGATISYLFQVFNNGPDAAVNASLKITVPTNTTFVSLSGAAGWTCPASPTGGVLTCTRASDPAAPLNVGAPADSFTMDVTAPAGTPTNTVFTSTGFISSTTSDLHPADNQGYASVTVNPGVAGLAVTQNGSPTITAESFAPANNVIDPGETVTVSFSVATSGAATNLVGTLRPTGNVTAPNGPITFGTTAGAGTLSGSFTFTGDPTAQCGSILIPSIDFASDPASTSRGTVVFTPPLNMSSNSSSQEVPQCVAAAAANPCIETFDGVTAPTLPQNWTSTSSGSLGPWTTSATNPVSAPNDAFAPSAATVGLTELTSRALVIPAAGGQINFSTLFNLESGSDGMVLEISINGGAFQDIITAGGSFVQGGYTGTISSATSALNTRQAWTGLSTGTTAAPGYFGTSITLPAASNGQIIKLKWRVATDSSGQAAGAAGARIDNFNSPCTSVTAAGVNVSGRVLTTDGRGLRNARVTITDMSGTSRSVVTGAMGSYSFEDVSVGQSYVIAIGSNRFSFSPKFIQVGDKIANLDFIAGQ